MPLRHMYYVRSGAIFCYFLVGFPKRTFIRICPASTLLRMINLQESHSSLAYVFSTQTIMTVKYKYNCEVMACIFHNFRTVSKNCLDHDYPETQLGNSFSNLWFFCIRGTISRENNPSAVGVSCGSRLFRRYFSDVISKECTRIVPANLVWVSKSPSEITT